MPHSGRSTGYARIVAALGILATVAVSCAGDDAALRTLDAPDAHQMTLMLEVHDGWISGGGLGAPGAAPVFTIPTHTDLTIRVRNVGSVVHALTLYADDEARDALAVTPPIPPGEEATMHFHFHDELRTLLRDDQYPAEISARIEARP